MLVQKGIFGGSFDPFHLGHLAILKSALETGLFEEILLMPVGQPPLKGRRPLPASLRKEIIELSIEDMPRVKLSCLELEEADKPSYTVESLERLRALEPSSEWSLIYGSDVLYSFENWYKPQEIAKVARLYIAHRAGEDRALAEAKAKELNCSLDLRIDFFDMPSVKLSSTEIRADLAAGRVSKGLSPKASRFCQDWQLYRYDSAWQKISSECYVKLALLEEILAQNLSKERLFHSLSVMLYGLRLAELHQLDLERFALAALTHDLAKEWPEEKQRAWAKFYQPDGEINDFNLHGYAAAAYLQRELNISDEEILEAVALHSSAGARTSDLSRLLFLADTLEPHREYFDHLALMNLAEKDLNKAYSATLESKAKYMEVLNYKTSAALLRAIAKEWNELMGY